MQERGSYPKKYSQFFPTTDEKSSPPIDNSFLTFAIPSAKELYEQTVWRDRFELISDLPLEEIEKYLSLIELDNSQIEQKVIEKISKSLFCINFYFKKTDNRTEKTFLAREKLVKKLSQLRYLLLDKQELDLDEGSLQLHISSVESYQFAANKNPGYFPNSYRALFIYDLIVEELYTNKYRVENADNSDNLITDYLSVHSTKLTGFKKWNIDSEIIKKLSKCLQNMLCDRKAAAYLKWSLDQSCFPDKSRGAFTFIPLTANASLCRKPDNSMALNHYSYKYFSLVQYRYLLELKSLFTIETNEELLRVKKEMNRWENFRNQPLILKYESLADKVASLAGKHHQIKLGSWEDQCYWEETKVLINEQVHKYLQIYALNTQVSYRLFTQEEAVAVQKELKNCVPVLAPERMNIFQRNKLGYTEGYFISVKLENLAKVPFRNLLIYEELSLIKSKNAELSKLLLTNQALFATKQPQEWLEFLKNKNIPEKEFIGQLADWPKISMLFLLHGDYSLPLELIKQVYDNLLNSEYEDIKKMEMDVEDNSKSNHEFLC